MPANFILELFTKAGLEGSVERLQMDSLAITFV